MFTTAKKQQQQKTDLSAKLRSQQNYCTSIEYYTQILIYYCIIVKASA